MWHLPSACYVARAGEGLGTRLIIITKGNGHVQCTCTCITTATTSSCNISYKVMSHIYISLPPHESLYMYVLYMYIVHVKSGSFVLNNRMRDQSSFSGIIPVKPGWLVSIYMYMYDTCNYRKLSLYGITGI